jgi:hypothetical protein
VEAERDAELRGAEVRVKVAAEAKRVAEAKAAERAVHWAAEMDKALTYRRDVDRRDIHWREAARRTETEHRLERHRTLRRQEAAIHATTVAIEAAGNGDGATVQYGDCGGGYIATVPAT